MKSKILNLLLLTTILLMHLEGVVAPATSGPTVRAPVPIGAVVVSIAVVLYMVYRGVEGD